MNIKVFVRLIRPTALKAYLDSGQRKVETWLEEQSLVKVDFSDEPEIFININTMAELTKLTDLEKTR